MTGLPVPPQDIGPFAIGVGIGEGGHIFGITILHGGLASRHAGLGAQVCPEGVGLHQPAIGWAIIQGGLESRHAGLGMQVTTGTVKFLGTDAKGVIGVATTASIVIAVICFFIIVVFQ